MGQRPAAGGSQVLVKAPSRNKIVPLGVAISEARSFLNEGQYLHLADLLNVLQDFGIGDVHQQAQINPIGESLWMLEETGGLLGSVVAHVFFAHVPTRAEVVLLGSRRATAGVMPPAYFVIQLRSRLDFYLTALAG